MRLESLILTVGKWCLFLGSSVEGVCGCEVVSEAEANGHRGQYCGSCASNGVFHYQVYHHILYGFVTKWSS